MRKKTIRDLPDSFYKGKRIFVRVDFNVPIKNGTIQDDSRIVASLPTINYLRERGARLILASHLGRPKGKRLPEFSLEPVAKRLSQLLGHEVYFSADCIGEVAEEMSAKLKDGEVLLLENVRFNEGEEKNDPDFAKALASNAEIYVNDAFGSAHRKHASCHAVALLFKERLAGLLMEKELTFLSKVRDNPEKPFTVILGGAKVKDKIGLIENLFDKVDSFIIGGGMSYTFLKADGKNVGSSLLDKEHLELVQKLLRKERAKFILPVDHLIVREVKEGAEKKIVKGEIEEGWIGVDIGPESIELFKESLPSKGTIFWNGPLGVFEIDEFSKGTKEIALALRDKTREGVLTVTGGGDTLSALKKSGIKEDEISHASTGGGATLEFLAGKELPGVEVLSEV